MSREQESSYSGLTKANSSQFVYSLSQVELGGVMPSQTQKLVKKGSILRRNIHPTMDGFASFGMQYSGDNTGLSGSELHVTGNALAVAENSRSSFKLKYPLINHRFSCAIESIFSETVCQIAQIIESTDTITNIQSLKELLHRKGLNLRFEWLLLAKLKTPFHRELVMVHILVRTIKKILHEEIKLKSQVPAPAKSMKQTSSTGTTPVKNGMHARMRELNTLSGGKEDASDHFMGNQ